MRIIDLTLPLYDGMDYYCTGHFPWEVIFKTERTVPTEAGAGLDLGSFTMYSEPGTRFLCVPPKKIGDVLGKELNKLVLKEGVMLHIPKEPKEGGNPITAKEMIAGIEKCPARPGDAIVLHTGHGDDEKYYKLRGNWELWSPCLIPESIPPLADYLGRMKCPLFGYDTANLSWQCTDLCSLHREWGMRKPRPAPNTPEAKEAGKRYIESGKMAQENGEFFEFLRICDMLGGVVNCGEVKKERFKLIIAPLKVIDWGFVPATVYAIEE
ncbi:MAG: cyclase family protein [Deltaproteobacteria bacterium]|nr:MAG: cyclase family protein [Deltaproteobacteria bacterium]